jgi:uncharacterized protein (TIGR02147 family)
MESYQSYLQQEFDRRLRRNGSYSLRAFARDLQVPPSNLSEVLKRKRGISFKTASRICRNLRWNPAERDYFLALVEATHGRSEAARNSAHARLKALQTAHGFSEVSLETYEVISDWIHFALMEFSELASASFSLRSVARRFRLAPGKVRDALARLEKLGLIEKKRGRQLRWQQTAKDLATPEHVSSQPIREHHARILDEARCALENVPPEDREFSSLIFAVERSKIAEAKRELATFRRRFCKDLSDQSLNKDRVYCLSLQLFPLDWEKSEKLS